MVHVYRVCCHVDRRLKEDLSRYSWEIPIQAGAGLTGERICEICDDTGEHISYKNRQYCELTALYWIWKNDQSDYVGLSHYRRHFEVNEKDLETLADSDIDVVLTIPIFDVPSVESVYRRDHVEADWQVMMEGMKTLCPEYLKAARELSKGRFYYAYNMFLMRRPSSTLYIVHLKRRFWRSIANGYFPCCFTVRSAAVAGRGTVIRGDILAFWQSI